MNRTSLVALCALLSGCAVRIPRAPYAEKPEDPRIFLQSTGDMRGTIQNHSGTTFEVVYPNEANQCRTTEIERLKGPVADADIQAAMAHNKGIAVPANRPITVVTRYSVTRPLGGNLQQTTQCPPIIQTIFTEPNGKYLFQFSLNGPYCNTDVYDFRDSANPVAMRSIPNYLCDPGQSGKN